MTNFLDRVCDNKASCKKTAYLDQKWARNGRLKFFEPFWGHFGPKISTGPTLGPPSDFSYSGLGECHTPLEPYGQWLQEYAKKSPTRGGW